MNPEWDILQPTAQAMAAFESCCTTWVAEVPGEGVAGTLARHLTEPVIYPLRGNLAEPEGGYSILQELGPGFMFSVGHRPSLQIIY